MRKVIVAVIVTLCMVGMATLVIAGVPADKKTIKIDTIPGKKGTVTFGHAKHVDQYKKAGGQPISCKDCHHPVKADEPDPKNVKGCTACHVLEGGQPGLVGKKAPFLARKKTTKKGSKYFNVLFHMKCLECHKTMKSEGKKIHKCKTCHPKK